MRFRGSRRMLARVRSEQAPGYPRRHQRQNWPSSLKITQKPAAPNISRVTTTSHIPDPVPQFSRVGEDLEVGVCARHFPQFSCDIGG